MQKNKVCSRIRKAIENYIIFRPSKLKTTRIEKNLLGKFTPIRFITKDRVKIYAWFIKPKQHMPTILYLHGQAESILKHQNVAKFCLEYGYGLFLLSFREHYKSSGIASENGLYTDADSAIEHINKLGIETEDIILWGHSLGTVTALEVATRKNVKAVILQSPIKDIKSAAFDMCDFLGQYFHLYLIPFTAKQIISNIDFIQKFNSLEKIKKVQCPILLLHSKTDKVAPYNNSIELAQNNSNTILKIFDRGSHWNCSWCINSIFEFIESLGYNNLEKIKEEIK